MLDWDLPKWAISNALKEHATGTPCPGRRDNNFHNWVKLRLDLIDRHAARLPRLKLYASRLEPDAYLAQVAKSQAINHAGGALLRSLAKQNPTQAE